MTEAQAPTTRPDIDIRTDIQAIVTHYPPLVNDRFHFDVRVVDGVAVVSGHMRSLNTYQYFLHHIERMGGLRGVDLNNLYVDENIRLDIGRVLPAGVIGNVEYGTVVLSGSLPEDVSIDELVGRLALVPGVMRVVTAFRN